MISENITDDLESQRDLHCKLWHKPTEEMEAGRRIVAVHGYTFSVGFGYEFEQFGFKVTAWCYEKDLIDSARLFSKEAEKGEGK